MKILFLLAGLDSNINVYNPSAGDKTSHIPTFCHIGHWAEYEREEATVFAHRWHPTIPRLLLSSADDGSLHAWQFKENDTKDCGAR